MINSDIPVPWWFVVLSTTFDHFLDVTWLDVQIQAELDKVDHKVISSVDRASETIQSLILDVPMPTEVEQEIYSAFDQEWLEWVAVRSSATAEDGADHARAGQLDSFLNTTRDDLIEKVRHCRASLFTPRAIFYRFEKELHKDHISVAVVIQKMVQSEMSGIAFSVHPVTQDRDQMIIEAWYGLGEAIVSWSVTPDSYVVKKSTKEIQDITINHQQKALYRASSWGNEWIELWEQWKKQIITHDQILQLADIIIRIEDHYSFPCDIEWAYEDGKFYIVQSRPITTLWKDNISDIVTNTILSRIYSREKSLLYFTMRNDSDRIWYKDFLNYDILNNLFIIPPRWEKWSVRYSYNEFDTIEKKLKSQLDKNYDQFVDSIFSRLDDNRQILLPYLNGNKTITDSNDFQFYYITLVHWRSAMNTVFTVPDMDNVNEKLKEKILVFRSESEKYTEKMNILMIDYFEKKYLEYGYLSHIISPSEVIIFDSIIEDKNIIKHIEMRLEGCFMLNEKIYKLNDMDYILEENNIALENEQANDVEILSGSIAYLWIVKWKVCIVHGFKDLDKVQQWSILVTEMTNPEYVPAMKKASAIITDEWWITCHASIASRELKIPCIVGTKIATQVLKDGDLVEVDADNGVVRVLERAGE